MSYLEKTQQIQSQRDILESRWSVRLVTHVYFSFITAAMILLNAMLIGLEMELGTNVGKAVPLWLVVVSIMCDVYFLAEVSIRIVAFRDQFLTMDGRVFNVFDSILVLASVLELVLVLSGVKGSTLAAFGTLKTLKLMRTLRIFRVFKVVKPLGNLAVMILESVQELAWAIVLLLILIYVFGCALTQTCVTFLEQHITMTSELSLATFGDPQYVPEYFDGTSALAITVYRYFGSIPRTSYTLFQIVLGGVSWGEITDPLFHVDILSPILLSIYILFTLIAVVNIITGVFVGNAIESVKKKKEYQIEKEMEVKEQLLEELQETFMRLDQDGSGDLSLEEVEEMLRDPEISAYFHLLGLNAVQSERLFRLLDTENCGRINIREFMEGCIRLKGPARSIDIHSLLNDIKTLKKAVEDSRRVQREASTFGN